MPTTKQLLQQVISLLEEVIRINTVTAPVLNLRDTEGKVKVSTRVQPVVQYDPTTGDYQAFGTWKQPQTYYDDIYIKYGVRLKFEDIVGTYTNLYMNTTTFNFSSLGNVIFATGAGGGHYFQVGGSSYFFSGDLAGGNGSWFYKPVFFPATSYARFYDRAAPAAVAGSSHVYAKSVGGVSKLFGMDGAGTETQLTP